MYRSDRYINSCSYNARTTPKKIFEEHIALLSNLPLLLSINLNFSQKRKLYADWYISSIPSTYEFLKQIVYLQKKIGVKLTVECFREWMKGNK